MKRVIVPGLLFVCGIGIGYWLANAPRSVNKPESTSAPVPAVKPAPKLVTLTLSAEIDGSDRFIFTRDNVWNDHGRWQAPKNITFNGQPWIDVFIAPEGWTELAEKLDLSQAALTTRKGRDVIALEHTADGFDLYFVDSQMGSAIYEAVITIPEK